MTAKKKVLFVGSFKDKAADGSVGGQMFACRTLINSELKDNVDFVLIDTTAESVPGPPIYKKIPKAINRLFAFVKALFRNKIDSAIIFCSSGLSLKEKGLMVLIAGLFRVKVVFAPRSGRIPDEIAKSAFTKQFLKRVIRSAGVVLCQGTSWRVFYSQFDSGNSDKFKVLINWIDIDKYSSLYELRRLKKRSPNSAVKLLYLGWFEPYKGIQDFLEVFNRLHRNGYEIEADVYGSGTLLADITNRVNELGLSAIFKLLGWADEQTKFKAIEEADIFVLPSYAEGTPNALIEAMTAGLACISTNVGGVPDLITDHKNGLIFDPGDLDKLYNNIVELCSKSELREALGEEAHLFTVDNCSVNYAVNYLKEIL